MKKIQIILAVSIVLSLVFIPGCKTGEDSDSFDILGMWSNFDVSCPDCYYPTWFGTLNFSGSATGGSVTFVLFAGTSAETSISGSWSVSGSAVNFQFSPSGVWSFNGTIASNNSMSGNANLEGFSGTWSASR
jgi:hypothetical protein